MTVTDNSNNNNDDTNAQSNSQFYNSHRIGIKPKSQKPQTGLTLPLVMAPTVAGAKNPVADPKVLVIPSSVPARLGAMSCSERAFPL